MIVVTTPTGTIGGAVLRRVLNNTEQSVRVVVRDPDRLPPQLRDRVEVVVGSHTDPDVISSALANADSLFWLVPPRPEVDDAVAYYRDATRPACEAIRTHGVRRVVAVSSLGREAAPGTVDPAALVVAAWTMDDLFEATGADYRALRMPAFMDNLLDQLTLIREQGVFVGSQSGSRPGPACATRDIAAVAAGVLLDDTWSGQGSVPVLGPEDLSFDDMARIASELSGQPVRYRRIPAPEFEDLLRRQGMGQAYAHGIVENQAAADRGIYTATSRSDASTTATSFAQWCRETLMPALQTSSATT